MKLYNIYIAIKILWSHLEKKGKNKLKYILILMIMGSITEAFSIGALLPFLAILNDPEKVYNIVENYKIAKIINIKDSGELLIIALLIFVMLAAINGIIKILILKYSTKVSFEVGQNISSRVYGNKLYQDYKTQLNTNSSETIDIITNKTNGLIYNTIIPILNLINSAAIMIMIIIMLLTVEPTVTTMMFAIVGFIYLIVAKKARIKLQMHGEIISKESTNKIKNLQEGLSSVREIIMNRSQEFHIINFEKIDQKLRNSQEKSMFISQSPRIIIEAFGVVIISILSYLLINENQNKNYIIGILGSIALGVQRMLPALQSIYSSWSSIYGNVKPMTEIIQILELKKINLENINLKNKDLKIIESIELESIKYKYDKVEILKDINIKINKGDCIGVVGTTGSGKSTLIDLIMGLLEPSDGEIKINNKKISHKNIGQVQEKIAHVPQQVYLIDASIKENIAFGIKKEKIDNELIKEVAKLAQISNEIEELEEKYETVVGERGVKLSGGQIQRIGIARALYKKKEILILDEATSALDNDTEEKVMKGIELKMGKITIIIIAHRLSTLKHCNKIIRIENGKIEEIKH